MIESGLSATVNLSNKLLSLFKNLITLFSIFLSKGILKKIELKSREQFEVEHPWRQPVWNGKNIIIKVFYQLV